MSLPRVRLSDPVSSEGSNSPSVEKPKIRSGRGGWRPGGGRPPGAKGKRTIAREQLIEEAARQGISPLEVMLKRMRYHDALADKELAKGKRAKAEVVEKHLALAAEAAKDAAPYQHPRLAAIEHMGKGGGPIEYSDARNKLAGMIEAQAAALKAGEETRH